MSNNVDKAKVIKKKDNKSLVDQEIDIYSNMKSLMRILDDPDGPYVRKKIIQFAINIHFTRFRLFIIVINCIVLALDRHPLTIDQKKLIILLLFLVNIMYIVETVVVVIAVGINNYIKDFELLIDVGVNVTVIIEFFLWSKNVDPNA
jgi:hypothetical protein